MKTNGVKQKNLSYNDIIYQTLTPTDVFCSKEL